MMNPIALILMIIGGILLVFGVFWTIRRSKAVGVAISLIGLCVAVFPILVSMFLAY